MHYGSVGGCSGSGCSDDGGALCYSGSGIAGFADTDGKGSDRCSCFCGAEGGADFAGICAGLYWGDRVSCWADGGSYISRKGFPGADCRTGNDA